VAVGNTVTTVSTVNPLVAAGLDGPKDDWSGVWIAEDIELIAQGVRNGSWIDGSLGVVGAGLDALAIISDPVGALLQYGVAWIIEHVKPLSEALDWLAGDPGQIAGHAQTWRNVASSLRAEADGLARSVRFDVAEWQGAASDAYRTWAGQRDQSLQALAQASDTLALITEGAGMLIGTVRVMVRDAVATVVSRLIVYAGELIASFGLATPLVVEQVSTLCASWAAKISRWLKDLISSLRNLGEAIRLLGRHIGDLKDALRGRHAGTAEDAAPGPRQSGGELRRPRNGIDFEVQWADQAYDSIRSADDIGAAATTASRYGFSEDDVRLVKDHVFFDEHLKDMYGEAEVGRFDANPRIVEAWQRIVDGNPHPADLDWLAHERYEAKFMADTGSPSYDRAHSATNDAGYTWDAEAAAKDGVGYRRP
jgi:uncharacterized protein YukE